MEENAAELCRRWKRGFEAAESMIRAEKNSALAGMSSADSRAVYDGLCGLYYSRGSAKTRVPGDPAESDAVVLRRRLNSIADRLSH